MGDFILTRLNSDEKIILKRNESYTLGCGESNQIVRVSPLISDEHCMFIASAVGLKIYDLGSSTGIFINGKIIVSNVLTDLFVNDTIGIGCESVTDITPNDFVYVLSEMDGNSKRKVDKELNGNAKKIQKIELDPPEIIEIDDDSPEPPRTLSTPKLQLNQNVSHRPTISSAPKSFPNQNRLCEPPNPKPAPSVIDLDDDIQIIDVVTKTDNINNVKRTSTTSTAGGQKNSPAQLPSVSSKNPVLNAQNNTVVKVENENMRCSESDVFRDFSEIDLDFTKTQSPPSSASQQLISDIKCEPKSLDFSNLNGHYSQVDIIDLSDDDDENYILPSQLINNNEETTNTNNDKSCDNIAVNNDNSIIKREPIDKVNRINNSFSECDGPLIIELSDDDDDDEVDETTKSWIRRIASSQLENQSSQESSQPEVKLEVADPWLASDISIDELPIDGEVTRSSDIFEAMLDNEQISNIENNRMNEDIIDQVTDNTPVETEIDNDDTNKFARIEVAQVNSTLQNENKKLNNCQSINYDDDQSEITSTSTLGNTDISQHFSDNKSMDYNTDEDQEGRDLEKDKINEVKKMKKLKKKKKRSTSRDRDNKHICIDKVESTSNNFMGEDSDPITDQVTRKNENHDSDNKTEVKSHNRKSIKSKRHSSAKDLSDSCDKKPTCRFEEDPAGHIKMIISKGRSSIDSNHGQANGDKDGKKKINDRLKKSSDSKPKCNEDDNLSMKVPISNINDGTSNELIDKNTEKENTYVNKQVTSQLSSSSPSAKKIERKIPQIEPPHLTRGEHRGVSINIERNETKETRGHDNFSDDENIFTEKKITKVKRSNKDNDKDVLFKRDKVLSRTKRKIKSSESQTLASTSLMSSEEKRELKQQRNEKLKQIADVPKNTDENSAPSATYDAHKRTNKPRAKISATNRGDFLVPKDIDDISDSSSDESEPVETLIIPKSQELQQNTAAQDLFDVISGCSANFVDAPKTKSLEKSKKISQKHDIKVREPIKKIKNDLPIPEIDNIHDNIDVNITAIDNGSNKNNDEIKIKNKPTIKNDELNKVRVTIVDGGKKRNINKNENVSNLKNSAISTIKKPSTTKKRVQFNDIVDCRMYFIEPGNTLTKRVQKDATSTLKSNFDLMKSINCPKLEDFLLKLFQWKPEWLIEQRNRLAPPPIVDNADISDVSTTYASYHDYYRIMSTLMLMEIWYIISQNFDAQKLSKNHLVLFASIVDQSLSETIIDPVKNLYITTFMLEAVVTEQTLRQHLYPVHGDLVTIELCGLLDGNIKKVRVFAYVNSLHLTIITRTTRYNSSLNSHINNPHTLLTYTMTTKKLPISVFVQKPFQLRKVIGLRSNLRIVQALDYLPLSPLLKVILNPSADALQLPKMPESYALALKDQLNNCQHDSVIRIANAIVNEVPLIHMIQGPPGTGKSKVIINLITEILYGAGRYENNKSRRILVCAASNGAVDEITQRLLAVRSQFDPRMRFKMVRIGHEDSIHNSVKSISLSELARRDVDKILSELEIVKQCPGKLSIYQTMLKSSIATMNKGLQEQTITNSQKQILQIKIACLEARQSILSSPNGLLDSKCVYKLRQHSENIILFGANIITCTLSSCYANQMKTIFGKNNEKISVCIMDEATMCSEPETLVPLMLGVTTFVLVGDSNQVPPSVISQQAQQLGYGQSLFARIQSIFDGKENNPIMVLNTQYRMPRPIAQFPSLYFYDNTLSSCTNVDKLPFCFYKIIDLPQLQINNSRFSNDDEAAFIANLTYTMVTFLDPNKFDTLEIGIITPYNDQCELITNKLKHRIAEVPDIIKKKILTEVNTVDSFRGHERDVIILSCVRNCGIGLLSDRQRLCVALTRAKHTLLICGNFKTFEKDPMWCALLNDARDRNVYIHLDYKAEPHKIREYILR